MRKLERSKCAILPLVLKGRWYDMIERGEKREEYRDATPYWKTRIENWWNNPQGKTLIVSFSRGYRKPGMYFTAGLWPQTNWWPMKVCRREGQMPEWGEPVTPHFVILLGERVEVVG